MGEVCIYPPPSSWEHENIGYNTKQIIIKLCCAYKFEFKFLLCKNEVAISIPYKAKLPNEGQTPSFICWCWKRIVHIHFINQLEISGFHFCTYITANFYQKWIVCHIFVSVKDDLLHIWRNIFKSNKI